VVHLTWDAAADRYAENPVLTYEIDRSVDQTNWSPIAAGLSITQFDDSTTAFSVHYYYRINASDNAAHTSGYSYSDVTTPAFTANVDAGGSSFTSEDGFATVTAPANSIPVDFNCTVATNSQVLKKSGSQKIVAGPYQLVCKNTTGDGLTNFGNAVTWTIKLKGRRGGVGAPGFSTVEVNGSLTAVKSAAYDPKTQVSNATTDSTQPVAVVAPVSPGFPWSIVAAVLFVAGLIIAVIVLISLRRRNLSYRDYLSRKYYEI